LIHYLIKAAGYGSNMLLNVGPMPNGKIQPKHQTSLKNIGKWLALNAESIYGTQRGPIAPTDDFVSTQKGKTVYLHILNPKLNIIHMGLVPVKIKNIRSLNSQYSIPFRNDKFGLVIDVSRLTKDDIDTVIQIDLK